MATIEWIEDTATELVDDDVRPMIDKERATEICRRGDLGISRPEVRIEQFISALGDLFRWFASSHRDFPWRRTRDPWKILVAEILLQRTRATKAAEVYRTFHHRFVDAAAVHRANQDAIFETVEPLGFGNKKRRH